MGLYEYFRLLLLILSLLGLFILIRYKYKLATEFIPIIVFSGIGLTIFLAGLLNILKLATLSIFFIGIYGLTKYKKVLTNDRRFFKSLTIFGIFSLYLLILLKNALFIHYDNFSHWGLVAREILETNSFPNFKNTLITFQSYSTGSASFIYYICKIIGTREEGMMSFAQSLLNLSALYSLGSFINKKNKILILPVFLFGIYVFIGNIMPYDLPVDTLLSSLSISLIAFILYYKDSLIKFTPFIAIVSIYILTIKSSGLFFILISWIFISIYGYKKQNKKELAKSMLTLVIGTTLTNYLWKSHVSYVYLAGNSSKHSVNFSTYMNNLQDKGKTKILEISYTYINKLLSSSNILLYIFLIIIILLVFKNYMFNKNNLSFEKFFLGTVVIYIFYQLSLYLMYIFSMPYDEAKNLDSFDRYDKTIVMFIIGLILVFILQKSDKLIIKNNITLLIITLILVMIPLASEQKNIKFLIYSPIENTTRYKIHELIKTKKIYSSSDYIIYIKNSENISLGYLWYVLRYELKSNNIIIKDYPLDNNLEKNSLVLENLN